MRKKPIIAIDGPAGAGKSTIARSVARKLGFIYIDSGALYRALTWKALDQHVQIHNSSLLTQMAKTTDIRLFSDRKKNLRVLVDGKDVTNRIRTEKVSFHTHEIARVKGVRRVLNAIQKQIGKYGGVVMEGRDIGTRIFPDAELKFYLDASPLVRARRRYAELKSKGRRVTLEKIAHALAQRDYKDKNRGISPLRRAADAIVIDSTHLSPPKVAQRILEHSKRFAHS